MRVLSLASEVFVVPLCRGIESLACIEAGLIAKQALDFIDRSQGMGHIAGADGTIFGGDGGDGGIEAAQVVAEDGEEFVEIGLLSAGDIVDLIESLRLGCEHCPLVGLDDIVDISEVAGVGTVSIDHGAFMP